MTLKNTNNIHYSRAGDIFHYRWAAKRCLKLLDFDTNLKYITVEGSFNPNFLGEDVVDLAEYREDKKGNQSVEYFQLKHSTVRAEEPFNISDLKNSITGFAQRFIEHQRNNEYKKYKFTIITNREISKNFKRNILKIANGEKVNAKFLATIKKYTKTETTPKDTKEEDKRYRELSSEQLQQFCSEYATFLQRFISV